MSVRAQRVHHVRIALVCAGTMFLAAASGCSKRDRVGATAIGNECVCPGDGGLGVIDDALLAYLSGARVLHHQADIKEDEGDVRGAVAELERLVAKPPPHAAPEVDEVLADTRARLGELRAGLGDFDLGARDVERGLALAPNASYFRGHLLEVRGLLEEKRAKSLAAKGDAAGAARAREAAKAAYEQSIAVQDEVIRKGTADGGAP